MYYASDAYKFTLDVFGHMLEKCGISFRTPLEKMKLMKHFIIFICPTLVSKLLLHCTKNLSCFVKVPGKIVHVPSVKDLEMQ